MTSFHRLAIVALSIALAGGAAAWLNAGAGAAVPVAKLTPPGVQPNGVNFTLHSDIDTSYCLEDTPAPQNAASEASMSQCVVRNGQRWTFADAANGSVVIIGGNTGKCLDFTAPPVSLVSMTPCTFSYSEHFFYNQTGQIELTGLGKCLEPAQAAQNALVSIVKCEPGVKAQIWVLGH